VSVDVGFSTISSIPLANCSNKAPKMSEKPWATTPPVQISYGIFLFFMVVISVPSLVLFYQRRHLFPIAQRYPLYILHAQIVFGLSIFISIFVDTVIPLYGPGFFDIISSIFLSGYSFTVMVARAWRFYFDYASARDKLAQKHDSWFLKYQVFAKQSFLKWVAVLSFIGYGTAAIVYTFTSGSYLHVYAESFDISGVNDFILYTCLINLLLMLVISYKLRGCKDGLYISKELFHCGSLTLIVLIVWGALSAFQTTATYLSIGIAIGYSYDFYWSIVFPLRESYKYPSHSSRTLSSRRTTNTTSSFVNELPSGEVSKHKKLSERFQEVLDDPVKLEAFKQFLTLELSIENILFFLDVQVWKKDFEQPWNDAANIKAKAKAIFEKYLNPAALYEVNLPNLILAEVERALEADNDKLPATLFDQAGREIRLLMQRDSFRRFENSQKVQGESVHVEVLTLGASPSQSSG
jgi:hypothetical protein